ncbi:MAG: hypothetical protein EA350_01140 [Gemmatimonadales bacterium]|nr:MAG: hypothetical protein EA350_01140 [Gemmatimonadales bacterium]
MSGKGERPIPVRSVAPPPTAAPVPGPSGAERTGPRPGTSEPARLLEIDGKRWEVRAAGSTRTGQAPDAGALLLMITFTAAGGEDAEAAGAGARATTGSDAGADAGSDGGADVGDATPAATREALAVARSLDDLDDEVLAELLERSRLPPRQGAGPPGP